MYRGDTRLTGRGPSCRGPCAKHPSWLWQYLIEGGEVWAAVHTATSSSPAMSAGPEQFTPPHLRAAEDRQWGLGPPLGRSVRQRPVGARSGLGGRAVARDPRVADS